jgi:spore coat protein U-like protein
MVTFSAPSIARAIAACAVALAITGGGVPPPALATGTTSINTSATVKPDCKFNSESYELTVPALDTVAGKKKSDGFATIYITCNEGTNTASSIELGADSGKNSANAIKTNRAMISGDGTLYLDYKLGLAAGGKAVELPVCSSSACGAADTQTPSLPDPTTNNNEDKYKFSIYAYVASSYAQTAVTSDNGYTDDVTLYINP